MSADPTKVPGFPKVPANADPELKRYLECVAEAVEIRLGRRGDPIDRAITLRELIDSGMAKRLRARPYDPNRGSSGQPDFANPDTLLDTDIPIRPTSFTVSGAYSQINMSWDFPNYKGHNQTEIWGYSSNVIGSATRVGVSTGLVYSDPVGGGVTKYYWIRHVNTKGVHGPWNSTTGTVGQTATDVAHQLSVLTSAITDSQLSQDLNSEIDKIQGVFNASAWSSSKSYVTNDLVTHVVSSVTRLFRAVQASSNQNPTNNATYWADLGAYTSLLSMAENSAAEIVEINNVSSSSTSASAQRMAALSSSLLDSSGNEILSSTNFSTMKTAVFSDPANNVLRASSSQIDQLASTYTNPETGTANDVTLQQALETSADNVNGLRGQYSVKIDANGHVAGFGLASTTTAAGTNTSEFFVNADRFAILPDQPSSTTAAWSASTSYSIGDRATLGGNSDGTGKKLYQAKTANSNQNPVVSGSLNSTHWYDLSTVPFAYTNGETVTYGDGSTSVVPPGVYINNAYIKDADITAAKIGSVNADTISSGYLSADRIDTGAINASKLKIDNSSITSQEINGVPTLIIGQAGITTAMIGNAQVNTLQVAGNAISASDFVSKGNNSTNHLTLTMSDTPATNGVNQPYIFHIMAIVGDNSSNNAVLSPAGTYRLKVTTYTNGANAQSNIYWLYAYGTDVVSVRRLANANSGTVGVKAECFVDQACTTNIPLCMIQITGHTGKR